MVEKIIEDKNEIMEIIGNIGRGATQLIIQYEKKGKKAYFRTNTMSKMLPIDISRVRNL